MPALHPIVAVFPEMDAGQYAELREDIRTNGLEVPVVTWKGQIIDGRHRAKACDELGVPLRTQEFRGTEERMHAHVVSLNMRRRHLSESQRSLVAAKLATLKDGQKKAGAPIGAASQDDAARMLNVSRRSVQRGREVLTKGVPELVEAVEKGEATIYAAAAVAKQPPDIQRAVVAAGPDEVRRTAKGVHTPPAPPRVVPVTKTARRLPSRPANEVRTNAVSQIATAADALEMYQSAPLPDVATLNDWCRSLDESLAAIRRFRKTIQLEVGHGEVRIA